MDACCACMQPAVFLDEGGDATPAAVSSKANTCTLHHQLLLHCRTLLLHCTALHGTACCASQAKSWLCVSCQDQHGIEQRATTLYLHAMSYLHKAQPCVEDIWGPPACNSPACGAYVTLMAHKAMAEIQEELKQQG